jgi:hypothetical protein
MTKLNAFSRLARVTTALAAGVGLVTTVNVANAMGSHHGTNDIHSMNLNHVMNGPVKNEFNKNTDRHANRKPKEECRYITSDGKRCGGSATTTVNPTQPGGATAGKNPSPTQTVKPGFVISGQPTDVKGVSYGNGIATISNGVTTSAISNGKTLTVTSNSPGMITVTDGKNSVTMPGGSLTLSSAPSVVAGSNIEVHRNPNTGDVTFAINPRVASEPSKGTPNGTPSMSGTLGDDLKIAGKAAGNATATFVAAPTIAVVGYGLVTTGALIGTIEGHPIKATEDFAKQVVHDADAAINWVGGIF